MNGKSGTLVPTLVAIAAGGCANAEAPQDDARLSRVFVSAFECFNLASIEEPESDADWLFNLCLESGREFLKAVREGKLTDRESREIAPMYWPLHGQGPSDDFILGSIFLSDDPGSA